MNALGLPGIHAGVALHSLRAVDAGALAEVAVRLVFYLQELGWIGAVVDGERQNASACTIQASAAPATVSTK